MLEHIKSNLISYLLPIAFTVCWIAFLGVMDQRHDEKGAAAAAAVSAEETSIESELRAVRRDKRQIQNYLDSAPSETYDAARQATLRELVDEEKELQEKIEKLRKQ